MWVLEVLPNSIQLMAQATFDAGLTTDNTVASMLKLQQTGGVISKEVLPHFAKRMQEAAQANGGLESALNSNRVAMNRMITSFQMAADEFFKSGFGEGLTDLFNSTASMIKRASPLWKALGKIIGSVMQGLSVIIDEFLSPALSALGSILNAVAELFGKFSGIIAGVVFALTPMGRLLGNLFKSVSGGTSVFKGLAKAIGLITAPLMIALGILEEIAEFFSPTGKDTLIGVNINDIMPDLNKSVEKMKSNQAITADDDKLKAKVLSNQYRNDNSVMMKAVNSTPIQVVVPINIDGNQVGEAVANTTPIKDSIDAQIAYQAMYAH